MTMLKKISTVTLILFALSLILGASETAHAAPRAGYETTEYGKKPKPSPSPKPADDDRDPRPRPKPGPQDP